VADRAAALDAELHAELRATCPDGRAEVPVLYLIAFGPAHLPLAQALAPRARARLVDGERLGWYGPRTAAGLRSLRALAAGP
jgi:hypothetical protein